MRHALTTCRLALALSIAFLIGCTDDQAAAPSHDSPTETPEVIDEERPRWPEGATLRVLAVGRTHVRLEWTPAEDNVAVHHYRLYHDNEPVGPVHGTSLLVTPLRSGTKHTFRVVAVDLAGNDSGSGLYVEATTQGHCGMPALRLGGLSPGGAP